MRPLGPCGSREGSGGRWRPPWAALGAECLVGGQGCLEARERLGKEGSRRPWLQQRKATKQPLCQEGRGVREQLVQSCRARPLRGPRGSRPGTTPLLGPWAGCSSLPVSSEKREAVRMQEAELSVKRAGRGGAGRSLGRGGPGGQSRGGSRPETPMPGPALACRRAGGAAGAPRHCTCPGCLPSCPTALALFWKLPGRARS